MDSRLIQRRRGVRAMIACGVGAACAGPQVMIAPLAACASALAQPADQPEESPTDPAIEPFEGRTIREVVLRAPSGAGELSAELEAEARVEIRTLAGAPLRARTISEDLRRLHRRGRFARASASIQPFDDGSVTVIFEVRERPIVRDVQPVNNRVLSDQEIDEATRFLVGTPVDRFQMDRAARRIEELYQSKGYYLARVSVDHERADQTGIAYFMIREGDRVKVRGIRFEGNHRFQPAELRQALKLKEAGILNRGPLDDDIIAEDVVRLAEYYRDRGYLDVRVGRSITETPSRREAIVTFLIDEGPLYSLREVRVLYVGEPVEAWAAAKGVPADKNPGLSAEQMNELGRQCLSPAQVSGLMEIKPGDVYGVAGLERSTTTIREAIGRLGYADARVERREIRDVDRPLVDLLLVVDLGRQYRVGIVEIAGNPITRHEVIRREIEALPGRPLDVTALEESRRRLERSRLFAPPESSQPGVRFTLQPPDPREPETRDVLVEVVETNTGSFDMGAAVSSDGGITGRIALTQRNFDASDTPDSWSELLSGRAFRGGGQTFNIELQPGDRVQVYSLSLTEPAVFDSDYSLSGSVYYRDRIFSEYDERRGGARIALGRRFGTRWSGSLKLRMESVELDDIDADAPTDVFDSADQALVDGIGFELGRTSADDRIRPTTGNRVEFEIEQIGLLGGDRDFTKLRAEYAVYIPVHEDILGRRTVLSLTTRANYIPQDVGDVPVYERFYEGGQRFRGFDFRGISPRGIRNDNGQPSDKAVGGNWSFFAGAEINQPVYEDIFSVVGFVDTGTVLDEIGFEDYRLSVGAGIRLKVPFSPVPLAFDFGVPILSESEDEERLFSFSLDIPFQ